MQIKHLACSRSVGATFPLFAPNAHDPPDLHREPIVPLDITEYKQLACDALGHAVQAGQEPAIATQQLTPSGVSGQSVAFANVTAFVRLHTDVNCRIAFGENPTAAAGSMRLPAGATEFFGVRPGHKVAVISSS